MDSLKQVNLCSPREVSALLENFGIHPSKALGQNFLVDRNILKLIVDCAGIDSESRVLEVGAGLGVLTEALLNTGANLRSVEKDTALQPLLKKRFEDVAKFELICADALELSYNELFAPKTGAQHLVANLPYSVGTRVVVEAAICANPPQSMTLLLQKEVCQRFAAPVSTPDRGAISVWLQQLYDVKIVRDVPGGCFVPKPDVVSSIVHLSRHNRIPLSATEARQFRALVKNAFLHRRKQLASAMRSAGELSRTSDYTKAALERLSIAPMVRPEELTVEQWVALSKIW